MEKEKQLKIIFSLISKNPELYRKVIAFLHENDDFSVSKDDIREEFGKIQEYFFKDLVRTGVLRASFEQHEYKPSLKRGAGIKVFYAVSEKAELIQNFIDSF